MTGQPPRAGRQRIGVGHVVPAGTVPTLDVVDVMAAVPADAGDPHVVWSTAATLTRLPSIGKSVFCHPVPFQCRASASLSEPTAQTSSAPTRRSAWSLRGTGW